MKRLAPIALGVMLLALMLAACSGGAGPTATPPEGPTGAEETPTPDARSQGGAELTVEEYAEAMEEIVAAREERIEAAAEGVLFGTLFSRDELERIGPLETSESWSDEDVEFASGFAETMLRAVTGLYSDFLRIASDSLDQVSSLGPPDHLSDPHGNYVATSREVLQVAQDFLKGLQDVDTDIGDREELADFMAALDTLESGPSDAEELEERAEGACLELEGRLEAELERDVSICDPDASGATSAEPALEPAPTAASALEPATTPTRELIPAADEASTETDREALVALYHATDGPDWTNNDNWLSDEPLDEWYGVDTNINGRVDGLALYENALRGELPAELGQLSSLERLYLFDNELSGAIPPELGQLSALVDLLLEVNDLSGPIPPELGQLSNLLQLGLFDNKLSGPIPPGLGQLSQLDSLDLADNDLTGEIPAELGQLSLLTVVYLAGNELSGCVPGALGNVEENDLGDLGLPSC